jgi:uncharacterized repeat protein (TIGR01451 family)
MRRSTYYWSVISLTLLGFASVAVAQEASSRAKGSPTLFDILQSRLKASGLTHEPAGDMQTPSGSRYGSRQSSSPAPKRVIIKDPRVLTKKDVPESAPLPVASKESTPAASTGTSRMHQRLSAFRNSQFGSIQHPAARESSTVETESDSTPQVNEEGTPINTPGEYVGGPTLAPKDEDDEPRIVGEALPGANLPEPRMAKPEPKYATESAPEKSLAAEETPTPTRATDESRPKTVTNSRAKVKSSQVLFTQQSPVLNVKTVGPERIDVGREATFRVTMENLGGAPAEDLIVAIDFPQWADLLGAEVSTGATSSEVAVDGTRLFRWKIGRLGAKDVQTVVLHVVARQSQPLNLAVNWQHAPVATATSIHVLQPELKVNLDGPEEVLFGKRQLYRLELENTGTGDARSVSLSLLPLGTGQEKPAVQPIGDLKAGQKKAIEVELTARNEGDLVIQVDATAEGNVHTHLSEKVRVLRPALAVDVAGPEFQFVGQEVTYRIVVTNPGTAKTSGVVIDADVPDTLTYVSSTKDGLIADEDGKIQWAVEELGPQESRTLLVNCVAAAAGASQLLVNTKADDNLVADGNATVQIDAIADLALEVTDPPGPVAVGTETQYQVKVENRGSKAADSVEIVAYFSHGIEPLGAEGGNYQVGPGQIVFDAIPSIAAGQAKTFVVKARAESTGNHIIRAEVFCKPLGTRLVGEESTYFYGKRTTEPMEAAPPRPTIAEEGVLTADQRGAAPAETSEQPQE